MVTKINKEKINEIILTVGSFLSPKIRDFISYLWMKQFIYHMKKTIYLNMIILKLLILYLYQLVEDKKTI